MTIRIETRIHVVDRFIENLVDGKYGRGAALSQRPPLAILALQ
jgi:hypothetical protein